MVTLPENCQTQITPETALTNNEILNFELKVCGVT